MLHPTTSLVISWVIFKWAKNWRSIYWHLTLANELINTCSTALGSCKFSSLLKTPLKTKHQPCVKQHSVSISGQPAALTPTLRALDTASLVKCFRPSLSTTFHAEKLVKECVTFEESFVKSISYDTSICDFRWYRWRSKLLLNINERSE